MVRGIRVACRVAEAEVALAVYEEHRCVHHRDVAVVADVRATPHRGKGEPVAT